MQTVKIELLWVASLFVRKIWNLFCTMSTIRASAVVAAAACVAAGAFIGYYLGMLRLIHSTILLSRAGKPGQYRRAFVYVVKLKLKPGSVAEFLEKFQPLADHCRLNEPRTLTVSSPS